MTPRPATPSPLDVLDAKEVARWLRKSPRTVQRQFKHIPGLPGRYLVADILEQWKAKKEVAA